MEIDISRGSLRQLLANVEAEHNRQLQKLQSELKLVQDRLALALEASPAGNLQNAHRDSITLETVTSSEMCGKLQDQASPLNTPCEVNPPDVMVLPEGDRSDRLSLASKPLSMVSSLKSDPNDMRNGMRSSCASGTNLREIANLRRADTGNYQRQGQPQAELHRRSDPDSDTNQSRRSADTTETLPSRKLDTVGHANGSSRRTLAKNMTTTMTTISNGRDRIAWKHDDSVDSIWGSLFRKSRSLQKARTRLMQLQDKDPTETVLFKCMNSSPVKVVCMSAIIANAFFIGAYTHVALQAEVDGKAVSDEWDLCETVFTAWFTVELVLRVGAERLSFLWGDNWSWNALDTFLVVSSLATVVSKASTPSLTIARLLRLFYFTRILRVLRVIRFLQNFRIMILAILQSFGTLAWVFVVLIFFKFFFAMIFMHGAIEHFRENGADAESAENINELFGGVATALLSLFEAITGGRDWHEIVEALLTIGWAYGLTFVVYVFFMVFLVLNVVVGGVVKTTSEVYKRDRKLITDEEQNRLQRYCDEIKLFFKEADMDGSGTLTWEEFYKYLHNDEKVKAYFQTLELDISQAHVLFTLLDQDESNEVAIDEFVDGCMRLKGQARSIDVNLLLYEIEKTMYKLDEFSQCVDDNFKAIEDWMVSQGKTPTYRRDSVRSGMSNRSARVRLRGKRVVATGAQGK